jgi:hypothetical protein
MLFYGASMSPRFLSQYLVWLQPIVFKNGFTLNTAPDNKAHGSGVNARLARQRLLILNSLRIMQTAGDRSGHTGA